ncbi:hotdog fold thioesterase [Tuberibacillus calidus]|uniref:hotdog fold thioesterase n=1 Tax=Tuberibacillus calidus TaxID=340097 RepID=UPI00040E5238
MSGDDQELIFHKKHYQEIMDVFKNEPYAKFLGIELTALGPGTASAQVRIEDHMLNSHGTVHGAIIFALADYVFAAACNSYGRTAVGLSTTVNFMAPAFRGKMLQAVATEEKRNHRTSWYRIKVESEGELVAVMEAMAYRKSSWFVSDEKIE